MTTTTRAWVGDLYLGAGWMVYRGPLRATAVHAHHAVQAFRADRAVTVVDASGGSIQSDRVVVPADGPHGLGADANGQLATAVYLDPSAVSTRDAAATTPASWAARGRALPDLVVEDLASARHAAAAVGAVLGGRSAVPADELVDKAMREVRRVLPETVRLAAIAAAVGSSPSRLTHRFTAAAGIPFRRWVLWERLQLAGRATAGGTSLTIAAHAAGFADSAHLNRTFRRMFGITPSDVAGAVTWHVDPQA